MQRERPAQPKGQREDGCKPPARRRTRGAGKRPQRVSNVSCLSVLSRCFPLPTRAMFFLFFLFLFVLFFAAAAVPTSEADERVSPCETTRESALSCCNRCKRFDRINSYSYPISRIPLFCSHNTHSLSIFSDSLEPTLFCLLNTSPFPSRIIIPLQPTQVL